MDVSKGLLEKNGGTSNGINGVKNGTNDATNSTNGTSSTGATNGVTATDHGDYTEPRANGVNGVNGINGANRTNGQKPGVSATDYTQINDETELREPVAIIGCGMRLPGGVRDGEAFWDFLINKKEGRCRVPANRYNIEAFYGPGKQGRVASEYGSVLYLPRLPQMTNSGTANSHFLEDIDLAEIDAHFWSMTAAEIKDMDPQQRLALEVVYECLQNSGTTNYEGKKIGTYFGIFGEVSILPLPNLLYCLGRADCRT